MQNKINVVLHTWMKPVHSKNTDQNFYTIGDVRGRENTLLVTLVGGNGGAVMFCTTHDFAYPIKGQCAECQNATHEVATEAGVATCYTPEIEQETERR